MLDDTLYLRIEPDPDGGFRLIKNGMRVPGPVHGLVMHTDSEAEVRLSVSEEVKDLVTDSHAGPIHLELVLGEYLTARAPAPSAPTSP